MKFKITFLLSSMLVLPVMGAHVGTTPASAGIARSKALELTNQLETLIKQGVVKNAAEIKKIENQLEEYVRAFKQVGQNKTASEIALRSMKLKASALQTDAAEIASEISDIKKTLSRADFSGFTPEIKTAVAADIDKLKATEERIQQVQKELVTQIETTKAATNAYEEEMKQKDAELATLRSEHDKLIAELKKSSEPATVTSERLKKMEALNKANQEMTYKLSQQADEISKLGQELIAAKASSISKGDSGATAEARVRRLDRVIETLKQIQKVDDLNRIKSEIGDLIEDYK